jgi:hypothetical protein
MGFQDAGTRCPARGAVGRGRRALDQRHAEQPGCVAQGIGLGAREEVLGCIRRRHAVRLPCPQPRDRQFADDDKNSIGLRAAAVRAGQALQGRPTMVKFQRTGWRTFPLRAGIVAARLLIVSERALEMTRRTSDV